MALTEKQQEIHKEFRKYLRTVDGNTGLHLNNLMKAAEESLPELIREKARPDFQCLYDELYSIQDLVYFAAVIRDDDDLIAANNGYISLSALEAYIRFFAHYHRVDIPEAPTIEHQPKDDGLDWNYVEGGQIDTHGVRYERDKEARKKCIEHYGCKCFVCGFDFEATFGELGNGFIEVHHIRPISDRSNEEGAHKVDPINDLRPLCPNCHAMIHRNGIKSIEQLKNLRRQ